MSKLTEADQQLRKAILDSAGNLGLAAQKLGIDRDAIYQKLRARKQKLWWIRWKSIFSRQRNAARQRRWYKKSCQRMAALTIELQSGRDSL